MGAGKYIVGGILLMASFIFVTVLGASLINRQMCWQKVTVIL